MAKYIGIDLGTTYSAAATVDEDGKPNIIRDSEGNNIIPSCIVVNGQNVDVGEVAAEQLIDNDGDGFTRFKREMGNEKIYKSGERQFTPTDLSTFVLKKIVKEVKAQVGEIEEAVVTIPANFSHNAREATMLAAKNAGLKIKNIINEPTAAALYYAYKTGAELDGIYAVFDLGGGTFDISIIQAHGKSVEILSSDGVSRLGGDDFDKAIIEIIKSKLDGADVELTLLEAEKIKKNLTRKELVKKKIDGKEIEISREEFEKKIGPLLAQITMNCESAVEEAKLDVSQIKGVFMAGGSTRLPCIQKLVEEIFKSPPITTANVDEVVALGASIYAAYRADRSNLSQGQLNSVQKIKLSETTNKCFGTISITDDHLRNDIKRQNSTIIARGEKIPCSVTESFFTTVDGQEAVNCTVTESSTIESDPKFVKVIWEGKLSLPPGRKAGQEIKVTFSYDENQIMKCEFEDVTSNSKKTIDLSIVNESSIEQSNIDKFLVE